MRSQLTAKQTFHKYLPSPNLITPDVIKYGQISDKIVYEFSRGNSFDRGTLYGLTFLEFSDGSVERRFDLDACFYSKREAEIYIKELKRMFALQ